jgi:hypothetical protein
MHAEVAFMNRRPHLGLVAMSLMSQQSSVDSLVDHLHELCHSFRIMNLASRHPDSIWPVRAVTCAAGLSLSELC